MLCVIRPMKLKRTFPNFSVAFEEYSEKVCWILGWGYSQTYEELWVFEKRLSRLIIHTSRCYDVSGIRGCFKFSRKPKSWRWRVWKSRHLSYRWSRDLHDNNERATSPFQSSSLLCKRSSWASYLMRLYILLYMSAKMSLKLLKEVFVFYGVESTVEISEYLNPAMSQTCTRNISICRWFSAACVYKTQTQGSPKGVGRLSLGILNVGTLAWSKIAFWALIQHSRKQWWLQKLFICSIQYWRRAQKF